MVDLLPADWRAGVFVGRILTAEGPTPVVVQNGQLIDVSQMAPTVSLLLAGWPWAEIKGRVIGDLDALSVAQAWSDADSEIKLLSPIDLQVIKASGVTFAVSAVERVIEERARGVATEAQAIRDALKDRVGADIRSVKPGSEDAAKLKAALIADGLWSQYLEVAIGPDAEIFTKGPVLSSVGWGDYVGVRSISHWNNPEPEIALAVDGKGRTLGATLGNDVNLRDIEGRSALLLGKAKDANASCALGPFIRMFDDSFTIDDVRNAVVTLRIAGADGYVLEGKSSMDQISRDPLDLVSQALSEHQYPDGFVLFLGTLFAPTQDRGAPGRGFTHKEEDLVQIASTKLGVLENRVTTSKAAPPWTFGIADLVFNLARRGLLAAFSASQPGPAQ